MATISRLLKIIGLSCKRALQKRPIFSKETYNCKEPTNRSQLIMTADTITLEMCTYSLEKTFVIDKELTVNKKKNTKNKNKQQPMTADTITLEKAHTLLRRQL